MSLDLNPVQRLRLNATQADDIADAIERLTMNISTNEVSEMYKMMGKFRRIASRERGRADWKEEA